VLELFSESQQVGDVRCWLHNATVVNPRFGERVSVIGIKGVFACLPMSAEVIRDVIYRLRQCKGRKS
jgi:hypothetical protein